MKRIPDSLATDSVSVATGDSIKTRMEAGIRYLNGQHCNVPRQSGVQGITQGVRRVPPLKVRSGNLAASVHTGIRAGSKDGPGTQPAEST
jgi:hypothetical protein